MNSSNTTTNKANELPDSLSPPSPLASLCGNCGYLLTGLPPCGICPECGQGYRDDEIVLLGWATGPHVSTATAPPKRVWRVALASSACLLLNGTLCLFQHQIIPACLWFVGAVGMQGWLLYRRYSLLDSHGGTCHLRLTGVGFAQREGFGPVKLIPWLSDLTVTFRPERAGIYSLGMSRPGPGAAHGRGKMQWPISFEFECTPEQAEYLRFRIAEFRHPLGQN
jgi:hypothetical protein